MLSCTHELHILVILYFTISREEDIVLEVGVMPMFVFIFLGEKGAALLPLDGSSWSEDGSFFPCSPN